MEYVNLWITVRIIHWERVLKKLPRTFYVPEEDRLRPPAKLLSHFAIIDLMKLDELWQIVPRVSKVAAAVARIDARRRKKRCPARISGSTEERSILRNLFPQPRARSRTNGF